MPLSTQWYDDEHSIFIITITKDTTWSQYHQAVDTVVSEAARVEHRIDLIFHDEVGMPSGNPLPHLKVGTTKIIGQPNISHTIIAGSRGYSGFTRVMMETLSKSFMRLLPIPASTEGGKLLFMKDLDEAVVYIQKDRQKELASNSV